MRTLVLTLLGAACTGQPSIRTEPPIMDDDVFFETGLETGFEGDACPSISPPIVSIPGPGEAGVIQVENPCDGTGLLRFTLDAADGVFRSEPAPGDHTLQATSTLEIRLFLQTTAPGRYDGQVVLEHAFGRDTVQVSGVVPEEGA